MNTASAWIETFTGKKFELLDPKPEQICIEDIAHALSHQCRFTGHTQKFYSVAEHSVHTSSIVPPQDALWALLHDASEAYIADLSRPVKQCTPVGPPYLEVEKRIMDAVCDTFGLSHEMPPSVKEADTIMLFAEKKQIMAGVPWENKWGHNGVEWSGTLWCLAPLDAESFFMDVFRGLRRTTFSAAGV